MKKKIKNVKSTKNPPQKESLIGLLLQIAGNSRATPTTKLLWTGLFHFFTPSQQKVLRSFLEDPGNMGQKAKATRLLTAKFGSNSKFRRFLQDHLLAGHGYSLKSEPGPARKRGQIGFERAFLTGGLGDPGGSYFGSGSSTPRKPSAAKKVVPKKAAPRKAAKKAAPKKAAPKKTMPSLVPSSPPPRMEEPIGHYFGVAHQPPELVTCHFQASMESPALVNRPIAITVIISQESIDISDDVIADTASVGVDARQELRLSCRPVRNFQVIGTTDVPQAVPEPGQPATLIFNGQCTAIGPCEVDIDVWQGQIPICSLSLHPDCVTTRAGRSELKVEATAMTAAPLAKPVHQLRIRERISGSDTYYEFELDSPELGIFKNYDPVRIDGDRDKYVAMLYSEIEQMWQLSVDDPERFQQRIRTKGADLYSTLIPPELREILWQQRNKIDSIMVISTEPFIPWELVLVKNPKAKKASPDDKFLCEMGLVRWLFGWRAVEELSIRRGKARYVIPDYLNPNKKLTGSNLEKSYLEKTLMASPISPTPDEVEKILNEKSGFDLLHFSCHAEVETDNIVNGKLILQDVQVGKEFVDTYLTQDEVEQLDTFTDPRPLIFLSACKAGRLGKKLSGFGGFAKAFLDAGAGAFVGALWSIEEGAAFTFMKAWYDQLKTGKTLSEATILARKQAATQGDATYLAFVIYGHPNAVAKFL
jgi:hypothetical protein